MGIGNSAYDVYSNEFIRTMQSFSTVSSLFSLVILVLSIIATWVIFKKMGEPGWKAIIPFYSTYILYKRTWKTAPFWAIFIISVVLGPLYIVMLVMAGFMDTITVAGVISLLLVSLLVFGGCAAIITLEIIQSVKMSKAFGHGGGFAVGLIFLSLIFYFILAFGKSEYVGPGGVAKECNESV